VGLRRLTIRMHVGHLVTFDGYRAIRDCVVDEQRRIDNFDQLVAHSNTSNFALLPTLISLEIACTYADGAGRGSGRGRWKRWSGSSCLMQFSRVLLDAVSLLRLLPPAVEGFSGERYGRVFVDYRDAFCGSSCLIRMQSLLLIEYITYSTITSVNPSRRSKRLGSTNSRYASPISSLLKQGTYVRRARI
jgi:hypothetical protein